LELINPEGHSPAFALPGRSVLLGRVIPASYLITHPRATFYANLSSMFLAQSRFRIRVMAASQESSPICLLDDNLSVLKANERLLVSAGWEVRTFSEPRAFLGYAAVNQPRVAVIDMIMPEMDGLQVRSKVSEISPATRVIILTSSEDANAESKLLESGIFAFFFKPVDPETLLKSVTSAFEISVTVRQG
jgi:response regulator RpfG family c-di-GMP phosphodiesterase